VPPPPPAEDKDKEDEMEEDKDKDKDKDEAKTAPTDPAPKPKFTKRQVAGRLRQIRALYDEWLLTDDFYNAKVAECEAAMADL
jgi:hypothetical protein